jgi:hypothetical protein
LCFDFGALATAKAKLREQGVEINILRMIDFTALDVDTLPALFFGAAQKHQPQLTWKRAQELVTINTAGSIAVGLFAAYRAAMLEPDKNPQKARTAKRSARSGAGSISGPSPVTT